VLVVSGGKGMPSHCQKQAARKKSSFFVEKRTATSSWREQKRMMQGD
jgi:hypothetical protein